MNSVRPDKNEITQTLLRGKNCGQCLLERYAEGFGFDREDTDRIAACFGGGLEMGQTCGAVAGAVIVLGLAGVEPKDAREAVAKLRRRLKRAMAPVSVPSCWARICLTPNRLRAS